jgi:hypothetical protein
VTSINPLHTLLLAIVVAAILLWITSVVDLEPYFRPSTTGVDVKTTGSLDTVSSTIAMSETTFADVSPINSDHDVSPVNSDHDVSPIEALTKDEL